MKIFVSLLFLVIAKNSNCQELFTFTEPASNMPTKSIAIRSNNYLMKQASSNYFFSTAPEIMVGLSKKIMLHAETFFGNNATHFKLDGASIYAKYRWYSHDDVHSHFRVASFAKIAISNNQMQQEAIDFVGRNAGVEIGSVATWLLHKTAISTSISGLQGFNKNENAIAYTISAGQLLLPKEYINYEQTNMNVMLELLGQTNLQSAKSFIDIAPSIQFIFFSKARLDLGYRLPIVTGLQRQQSQVFFLRLEYNFFNAFK